MGLKDILALAGAGLALLVSGYGLYLQNGLAQKSSKLETDLAAKGDVTQLQLANKSAELQKEIQAAVALSDKRRFFFTTLWDKMTGINDIDPAAPVGPDIRKAINVLEAVAVSWEANIVDRQMVLACFGHLYNEFYDKVSRTNVVPAAADGSGPSGTKLLNDNPLIGKVNKEITEEFQKRFAITGGG